MSMFEDDDEDIPIDEEEESYENPLLGDISRDDENKKKVVDEESSKQDDVSSKENSASQVPSPSFAPANQGDTDAFPVEENDLRRRITNLKDKDDVIEILLLLEEIIQRFDWAKEKTIQDAQEQILLTKNLKHAGNSIHNYISEMKAISNTSKESLQSFDRSIDAFQKELVSMVQEIDLSPFQKAILENLNEALGKMPINEINNGVTHFISLAGKLKNTIDIWDTDSKEFEKRLFDSRLELKNTLEKFGDVIRDAEKVSSEVRGKRFGFGALFGALVLGSLLGIAGSAYLYQDYFGIKFDELKKDLQKNAELVDGIGLYKDPKGSYLIYDKKKMKIQRDGETLKLYFSK